jgi:hypothetical protein
MYLKFNEWYNVAWVKCSKDADGERYLQRVSSVEERVGANKALHSFVYDDAHSLYHAQRTIGIPTACLTAYCGTIGLSNVLIGARLIVPCLTIAGWFATWALSNKRRCLLDIGRDAEVADEEARFALLKNDLDGLIGDKYRERMRSASILHSHEVTRMWREAISLSQRFETFIHLFD